MQNHPAGEGSGMWQRGQPIDIKPAQIPDFACLRDQFAGSVSDLKQFHLQK